MILVSYVLLFSFVNILIFLESISVSVVMSNPFVCAYKANLHNHLASIIFLKI